MQPVDNMSHLLAPRSPLFQIGNLACFTFTAHPITITQPRVFMVFTHMQPRFLNSGFKTTNIKLCLSNQPEEKTTKYHENIFKITVHYLVLPLWLVDVILHRISHVPVACAYNTIEAPNAKKKHQQVDAAGDRKSRISHMHMRQIHVHCLLRTVPSK